jgi:hypothetical protein
MRVSKSHFHVAGLCGIGGELARRFMKGYDDAKV